MTQLQLKREVKTVAYAVCKPSKLQSMYIKGGENDERKNSVTENKRYLYETKENVKENIEKISTK